MPSQIILDAKRRREALFANRPNRPSLMAGMPRGSTDPMSASTIKTGVTADGVRGTRGQDASRWQQWPDRATPSTPVVEVPTSPDVTAEPELSPYGEIYDPLLQNAMSREEEAQRMFDEFQAGRQASLDSEFDQIGSDYEAMYAPRFSAATLAGERAVETGRRGAAFGGTARSGAAQAREQEINVMNQAQMAALAAEKGAAIRMARAQARGLSGEELTSYSNALSGARNARMEMEATIAERDAGLLEDQLSAAAGAEESRKAGMLEAIKEGYRYNEETGQYEALPIPEELEAELGIGEKYRYVTGTKFQPPGYYDVATGEFHPLEESLASTGGGLAPGGQAAVPSLREAAAPSATNRAAAPATAVTPKGSVFDTIQSFLPGGINLPSGAPVAAETEFSQYYN